MGKLKNNFEALLLKKYGVAGGARLPRQEKIAADTGLSQSTISMWMNDRVTRFDRDVIERLCEFFGCDVGDLLFIDRSEEPA